MAKLTLGIKIFCSLATDHTFNSTLICSSTTCTSFSYSCANTIPVCFCFVNPMVYDSLNKLVAFPKTKHHYYYCSSKCLARTHPTMYVHVKDRHSDFPFLPSKWKNSMHFLKQCSKTSKYILATLIFPGK